MKRLKLFISIFCLAISLPLTYVIWQTYSGLAQEERGQLSYFSEALFDEIQAELADLVQQEENRAVDEYRHTLIVKKGREILSPLALELPSSYILGYLQNNPDGSYQTPLVANLNKVPPHQQDLITQLASINKAFNRKKFTIPKRLAAPEPVALKDDKKEGKRRSKTGFAERYISRTQQKTAKSYLGKKSKRTEEITKDQALNLSMKNQPIVGQSAPAGKPASVLEERSNKQSTLSPQQESRDEFDAEKAASLESKAGPGQFQVEVAPLQSVTIGESYFFVFRRIAVSNQIYRQGFILKLEPFLRHLAATHFESQPMAQFTRLSIQAMINGRQTKAIQSGAAVTSAKFTTNRTFPAPFDFMNASVLSDAIPSSPARRTLNAALIVLGLVMLLGLFGIYQSARAVVALSERRSEFVSSVTHELKTPLTNIRMYIEMLEQGIAATPDREQDYFKILGSESTRLSRLINNVLELAKLEKKQRNFNLQQNDLEEVIFEVGAIMAHKLDQEGFELKINAQKLTPFVFDREVMIQVFINLLENSIKFGRSAPERKITIDAQTVENQVRIAVTDSGPGIPKKALKKIFGDFYRVDNNLTRTTGGTGIGLALVKKFISAMGGTVRAANNTGPGCTITLTLPHDLNGA